MTAPRTLFSPLLCLLPLLLVLAGCKVDQAKEVQAYRQILTLSDEDLPFEPGEPLSLRMAMLLANRHNETLAIEGENFVQALIGKKRAYAAFQPVVNLTPTYAFRDSGNLPAGVSSDEGQIPVTGNINLFNGFSDVARLRAATATIEQRLNLLLDEQELLLLDVAQVYYQVLRSQRAVEVLENSLRVQEERVRDIEARQAAGTARPLDVAQTRAQAAATRVTLIAALNDVRNARSLLALLTGAPVEGSELTDDLDVPAVVPDVDELLAVALARRRDLRAAEAAAAAARQDVEVAFGQYYPSVSLNLNGILAQDPGGDPDSSGLLRANLPLFSAGLIHADVRAAWSLFRQALAIMSFRARQVRQQVETAHQNFAASQERLEELRTQLAAAAEAFRQAEQSYNVGFATNLERITAQDQLLNAQLQLASEVYNFKFFFLSLLRATGSIRGGMEVLPAGAWQVSAAAKEATTNPAAIVTPNLVPPNQPATLPAQPD